MATLKLYADKNILNRLFFHVQRDIVYPDTRMFNLHIRRFIFPYGRHSASNDRQVEHIGIENYSGGN